MMKKTIVLFKTDLDTLNLFTEAIRTGFEEIGYDIFMYDMNDTIASMAALYSYMKNHEIKAMLGFNNPVFNAVTSSGANIWETLGIFCINILVDHPYWYHNILVKMPAYSAVLCIDKNHMKYLGRFYKNIAMTGFLGHGGIKTNIEKPILERSNELLYVGSLYEADTKEKDYSYWDFPARTIVKETEEYLLFNPNETIETVLERKLLEHNIKLEDDKLRIFISYNTQIERKLVAYYREMLLKTIAKSGLKLTLYGKGWEKCSWIKLPNVAYKGFISAKEVLNEIADSKIVINTMPWFKEGSHERIFNALLNGSIPVTEKSDYMEEIIPKNIYMEYELNINSMINLCDKIKELLADNKKLVSMSEEIKNITSEKTQTGKPFSWTKLAYEIDELLESI